MRPLDSLPLRREDGERIEGASTWGVGDVDQDGDRRVHLLARGKRQDRVGVGWALNEDDIGLEVVERLDDAACRAGTVMTDA